MEAMDKWLIEVAAAAREERLWSDGDTIVVAVSGGPDSAALLHMLHRLSGPGRLRLVAAHVDHGFRGEESAREAEGVRQLAAALGVPCETVSIDVPSYIKETGLNPHVAAREKRYAFLHEVAERNGARRIALGHHADDQAETVLMRILRGTSPGGLAGIPMRRTEKNVELIRPLLRIYKADILSYCKHWAIPYSVDSSNLKRDYYRNRVRLDVLPALKEYNPELPAALVRLSELAAREDDWMDREARRAFDACVRPGRDGCQMTRKALLDLHVALQRRLIKLILDYVGMETESTSFITVETVRAAAADGAASSSRLDLGGGVRLVREYEELRFLRAHAARTAELDTVAYEYTVAGTGTAVRIKEAGITLAFAEELTAAGRTPRGRDETAFDADRISFPLTVRNRRPGDRMRVMGLNGTKKVQDMFVDERVPRSLREKLPLLVDAEGTVIWIPGIRRSTAAPVTAATSRVLRVRAEGPVNGRGQPE
ncbi:tRNA lysidine(34) synthetase TilS [Paenibacillus humicola]|uniref:tRNA lysidine(34) synthetase TilS n=1 Tax=Paenibacillus humicola TaxID=3110540 RepID=UPI00237B4142|nr:tRNA lysidine(34) synthetase TilS [Paenibacillus humicola]